MITAEILVVAGGGAGGGNQYGGGGGFAGGCILVIFFTLLHYGYSYPITIGLGGIGVFRSLILMVEMVVIQYLMTKQRLVAVRWRK